MSTANSVTVTNKNVKNIGRFLQGCKDESGSLAEMVEEAEAMLNSVIETETEKVLLRKQEIGALHQLAHAYMLALSNQMVGVPDSKAVKLNRRIVWAGCVLNAVIPVIESQQSPLSDEEQRILAEVMLQCGTT